MMITGTNTPKTDFVKDHDSCHRYSDFKNGCAPHLSIYVVKPRNRDDRSRARICAYRCTVLTVEELFKNFSANTFSSQNIYSYKLNSIYNIIASLRVIHL